MGQRLFDNMNGIMGPLASPRTERRTEAMNSNVTAIHSLERRRHRHVREAGLVQADKDKWVVFLPWHVTENVKHRFRQGHPVLFAGLHASSRNRPSRVGEVNL